MLKTATAPTYRRLNVSLPERTVRLMDRVAKKGNRSSFIAEAVERYISEIGRTNLRRQIKEGALRRAERDLNLASEWFGIEAEIWHESRR